MLFRYLSVVAAIGAIHLVNVNLVRANLSSNQNTYSSAERESPNLAQNQTERDKPRWERRRGRFIEELGLSEEQQNQMREIRQKYRSKLSPVREKMKSTREELRNLMAGTATESAIRAKHREYLELQQEISKLRFESMLEMRQIMTAEQRQKFTELMQRRRERRGRRYRGAL